MRKASQKLLALTLLLPALLLSGCWQDSPAEEEVLPPENEIPAEETDSSAQSLPDTLTLAYLSGSTLDPITCPDGVQQILVPLLYEGLYRLDGTFAPQKVLCSESYCSEDGLQWQFTLRSDACFSDGSPLSAGDVTASLQRARTSARYQGRFSSIQNISSSGNQVILALKVPNAGLPALLDIPIVKSGTENSGVPIGTGPYRFISDEDGFHLEAADWWCGQAAPLARIELSDCSDSDTARYQFLSRGIQLLTADQIGSDPIRTSGSFDSTDTDTTVLHYLGFNGKRSLLSDPAVRRAISLGINRESLVRACLSGHGRAAQFPLSPASALYPTELEQAFSYASFEEAEEAAGLNTGVSHTLTLLVNEENSFKVSAANYLASNLSGGDLQVQVRTLPWDSYLSALQSGNYDLYYGEVRLSADWDLSVLLGSGGALNYGGIADPETDLLLSGFAAAADRSSSARMLCRHLQAQAPIAPLCFASTSVLTQRGVFDGLQPTAADSFGGLEGLSVRLAGH